MTRCSPLWMHATHSISGHVVLTGQAGIRLLDIGCAEGCLIEVARLMGFDAYGIDIADYYVPRWRHRALQAEVATVDILAARCEPPFDVIVGRQVFEHLANPHGFLCACADLLNPGGACVIETGDARSVQARLQRRNWSYWIPKEGAGAHISFLTVPSARLLGKRAGFELAETVSIFDYRPRTSYARQFGESSPSLTTTLKYLLLRYVLRGNLCYIFQRN